METVPIENIKTYNKFTQSRVFQHIIISCLINLIAHKYILFLLYNQEEEIIRSTGELKIYLLQLVLNQFFD